MARYRTGRKVGNTLYWQEGDEPSDGDTFIGSCVTPGNARNLVEVANAGVAAEERLEALEAFSLHQDKDGRTLLTYTHADGEVCVVAELTCAVVAEVAAFLWPSTDETEHNDDG